MNTGLIGGIVGSVLGIAGGLVGTYFSIKNTKGPRERRFMIRSSVVVWLGVSVFLATFFLVPYARTWIWYPYCILLPLGIICLNRKQQAIRTEEQSR